MYHHPYNKIIYTEDYDAKWFLILSQKFIPDVQILFLRHTNFNTKIKCDRSGNDFICFFLNSSFSSKIQFTSTSIHYIYLHYLQVYLKQRRLVPPRVSKSTGEKTSRYQDHQHSKHFLSNAITKVRTLSKNFRAPLTMQTSNPAKTMAS